MLIIVVCQILVDGYVNSCGVSNIGEIVDGCGSEQWRFHDLCRTGSLHWLPVRQRIIFKIATLIMFEWNGIFLSGSRLHRSFCDTQSETVAICHLRAAVHPKNQNSDIWTEVIQGLWSNNLEWSSR